MYQEMTVFEPSYYPDTKIYLCRGLAVNRAQSINKTYWPEEQRLLLTNEQKKELEYAIREGISIPIYRYVVLMGFGREKRTSSWFMAEQDASDCPLAKESSDGSCEVKGEDISGFVERKLLNTASIEPVQFPMVVDLEAGKDGRLSCRINLHPEVDGYNAVGMVCFPDRSMTGACAGKAMITGVKEKGTYGFLIGSMIQYGMPDWDKFLDYAWKHMGNYEVSKDLLVVNHPGLGRFLCLDGGILVETGTSPYCKEEKCFWPGTYVQVDLPNAIDIEQYVESRTTLGEIFLKDAFGDALTKEDILGRFPHYKFLDMRYSEAWQSSDNPMPEVVEQAIAEGFLRQVCLPGRRIPALVVVSNAVYRLASFSVEEIEDLAKEYAKINDEAKASIMARIKKGTLRVAA